MGGIAEIFYTEESAYIKLGGNVVRWIPEWREEYRGEGMCFIRRKGHEALKCNNLHDIPYYILKCKSTLFMQNG